MNAEGSRADLDPRHRHELVEGSGIAPEVVSERGYCTTTRRAVLEKMGFSEKQRRVPAMIIPMYGPTGKRITQQIKPDEPRKDGKGKPVKYETPVGSEVRLDVHPRNAGRARDASVPLWIVEGVKKADALASRGECAIALQGVWCWQRDGVALAEWEEVRLHGREVFVAFDSDVTVNPKVRAALEALVEFLRGRGAKASVVYIPHGEDGAKVGVDDFLVAGGRVADLKALAEHGLRDERPVGVVVSEVEPQRVSWLWPGRIPLGKLTLLDGDPGTGKSALTTDLAARVSAGRPLPDGTPCEAGGVVLLNAEDGLADTIRPRLEAAGADLSRVLALATIPDRDGERLVSIPEDLATLRREIRRMGARLVLVDPMMAFISGNINSHKDQDTRRALAPLAKVAEESGAAIVVVRHLNQATGQNPLYRGGGSIGIIGQARSALLVAKHPEDDRRRVLASLKSNLAVPAPSLAFVLTEAANGTARVEYRGETPLDANALLAAAMDDEDRREMAALRDAVVELLEENHGFWEGTATELHNLLAEKDLAALPDRPDELSKRLVKLARNGTAFAVSRGWRDKERVTRLRQHHDREPPNGAGGVGGVGGVGESPETTNTTNTTNTDESFGTGVGAEKGHFDSSCIHGYRGGVGCYLCDPNHPYCRRQEGVA